MATTEKRKPVFVKVDALKPGTNGHNLTVQVVSSNPIQVSAPTKPRRPSVVSLSQRHPITPARIAECLMGDETGCILFTARNEQVGRLDNSAVSASGAKLAFKPNEEVAVQVRTIPLDEVIPDSESVLLLKIDVHGWEYHILKGASKLLSIKKGEAPYLIYEEDEL